ncbi:hypothetical protein EVAR_44086_1 [Eumeta japonica]|uniref:Uncharacterized protein n=1 Tax=Eumeta variegata TaxID=151549 RepID=A0A4C1X4G7_EUMVA|nr:hypothetical protein EVAR_44086_1 [Eumeta japonica]
MQRSRSGGLRTSAFLDRHIRIYVSGAGGWRARPPDAVRLNLRNDPTKCTAVDSHALFNRPRLFYVIIWAYRRPILDSVYKPLVSGSAHRISCSCSLSGSCTAIRPLDHTRVVFAPGAVVVTPLRWELARPGRLSERDYTSVRLKFRRKSTRLT